MQSDGLADMRKQKFNYTDNKSAKRTANEKLTVLSHSAEVGGLKVHQKSTHHKHYNIRNVI